MLGKLGTQLGLVAVMGAAACGVEGDAATTEEDSFRVNWVYTTGWGCRTCGYKNSPLLGQHSLGEFTLSGGGSEFSLVSIEDLAGDRHDVKVVEHRIVASTKFGLKEGNDLLGWSLIFEYDGKETPVEIYAYAKHPDWAAGNAIDTYGLLHHVGPNGADAPPTNLCPDISLEETAVIFIEGERFDSSSTTLIPGQSGFVTAACRGHALMKMKFTGHDPNDAYGSSPEQRQASLKMFTADYCGNGQSFTTIGQALDWIDDLGNFGGGWGPGISGDLEARWDQDRAVCLNEPRNTNYDRDQVIKECGFDIPKCDGDPMDLGGAQWASYIVP